MLRRTLSAMAGAVALTGVAAVADPAAHSPLSASAPPAITWTGFYVGLNAGGTWSNSNAVSTAMADVFGNPDLIAGPEYGVASAMLATTSTPVKIDGFLGGGQIGYNYQLANGWVAGLELDFQGIAPEHSTGNAFSQAVEPGFNAFPIDQFLSAERSLKNFGTVRGRVGFLILPTLLAYGTGGLACGTADTATNIVQAVANDSSLPNPYAVFGGFKYMLAGWTAGGGLEWLFSPNWSLKVEYLFYDLGHVSYAMSPLVNINSGGVPFTGGAPVASTRFDGNIVRGGISYHFFWGASPVAARD
jgi:outer membrane immunogenic protein